MAVVHSSRLRIIDIWNNQDTGEINPVVDKHEDVREFVFADGDGDGQAQDQYTAQRTVLSNDEDILDVAGSLVDRFGNTLTFATIKQISIFNLADTAGEDLLVGGGPDPTAGALITSLFDGETDGRVRVLAGGVLLVGTTLTGYPVTGGSADVLWIRNDGTDTITYDIIIKGTRV